MVDPSSFHQLVSKTLEYLNTLKESSLPSAMLTFSSPLPKVALEPPIPQSDPVPVIKPPVIYKEAPKQAPSVKLQAPAEAAPTPQPLAQKKEPAFALNPLTLKHTDSLHDMRELVAKIAPSLTLISSIPSDEKAKRVKNKWKEESLIPTVALLSSRGPSLSFLENVAKAIEAHFTSSKVLLVDGFEQKNSWDSFLSAPQLKLIIAPGQVVWSSPMLMRHYKENPAQNTRHLGSIPVLLLSDASLYLKDPSLKRSLWNLLCQTIPPLL